jgi:hypothetical protein
MQALRRCAGGLAICVSKKARPALQARQAGRPIVTAQPIMSGNPPAPSGAPRSTTTSYGFKSGEPEFTVGGLGLTRMLATNIQQY